jgi:hypothetical protein
MEKFKIPGKFLTPIKSIINGHSQKIPITIISKPHCENIMLTRSRWH